MNRPPTATNFNATESNCCDANPSWFFTWLYGDLDGDLEASFSFQVDSDPGFTSPITVSRVINLSPFLAPGSQNNQSVLLSPSVPPPAGMIGYGINYWWQVKVEDNQGKDSGWLPQPPLAIIHTHRCPICDFTWIPRSPIPGEDVQFTNTSTCYNDSQSVVPCSSFSWSTIPAAIISTPFAANTMIVFSGSGGYNVSLTVTDGSNYQCSTSKTVRISLPLPRWKEI
ncbi:MAG: hypothetical protein A2V60_02425 [Candidatus Portnoybacteria bacterium RIFCSPHIGHO2_01_FULL_39_19]|nr:MAG: hypothetical protein A2V60_02425 [Candidatus Portnoybacteria bacterium RIFCSPHIGHO2_01_FULL_39_19]